jgi:hypothetical protein
LAGRASRQNSATAEAALQAEAGPYTALDPIRAGAVGQITRYLSRTLCCDRRRCDAAARRASHPNAVSGRAARRRAAAAHHRAVVIAEYNHHDFRFPARRRARNSLIERARGGRGGGGAGGGWRGGGHTRLVPWDRPCWLAIKIQQAACMRAAAGNPSQRPATKKSAERWRGWGTQGGVTAGCGTCAAMFRCPHWRPRCPQASPGVARHACARLK